MKGQIAFGGACLSGEAGGYGFGAIKEGKELIDYALELGITVFDTAPVYGLGESEKVLGKELKSKRESVQIISKSGVSWHSSGRINMTNNPRVTLQMLEASLKRLDTDYIDIYMIHWPDDKVDIRYPLEVLAAAQLQGKIKSIGLCNTHQVDLALARELVKIDYLQSEFNLFNNGLEKVDCAEALTMGWGTLDKGILAGSVTRDRSFEKSDARSWAPWWKKSNWKKKVDFVEKLNFDVFETAIAYSLEHLDYTLIGSKSVEQLKKCFDVSKRILDKEQLASRYDQFKSFS